MKKVYIIAFCFGAIVRLLGSAGVESEDLHVCLEHMRRPTTLELENIFFSIPLKTPKSNIDSLLRDGRIISVENVSAVTRTPRSQMNIGPFVVEPDWSLPTNQQLVKATVKFPHTANALIVLYYLPGTNALVWKEFHVNRRHSVWQISDDHIRGALFWAFNTVNLPKDAPEKPFAIRLIKFYSLTDIACFWKKDQEVENVNRLRNWVTQRKEQSYMDLLRPVLSQVVATIDIGADSIDSQVILIERIMGLGDLSFWATRNREERELAKGVLEYRFRNR